MADERNRKTGLGVDAFFPAETAKEPPRQKATARQTRSSGAPKRARKTAAAKPKEEPIPEETPERRTAWLLEEHMLRLERLKIQERRRLKREKKRVSMTTLIDEALEAYLQAKGF